ncbi:LacI family DNA-binding transcriptional regulator [Arthrobacter sp.]|uniref:LacI family DNA-binding transcriptional regulator n=1 Tax=Arthrobacter sp. TaxID=1667 RepID=UPI00281225BB|nr:LacI family DNA-binding transcriptional regulator [Arthrobacter sp.]
MESTNRKTTIKHIAEAAGVHPSTVSRALNGLQESRIPQETVDRIHKAAAELQYEPNPWAQSLRTKRAMMIGLAIPRFTDYVLAQMFESAQIRATEFGYDTLTAGAEVGGKGNAAIKGLMDRRTDGLILATAKIHDEYLAEIERSGVPFVLLNRRSGAYPAVTGDDELGGYLATRHLIEQGHHRIGHISGPLTVSTADSRARGYRRAIEEADLPIGPELMQEGRFDARSAGDAAEALLSLPERPTAIFAVNDISALAAMATARQRGLAVPEDVAVVGYNDSEVSSLLPIPLTSVRVPLLDMGSAAVDLLLALMNGKPVESIVKVPELIPRESSLFSRS